MMLQDFNHLFSPGSTPNQKRVAFPPKTIGKPPECGSVATPCQAPCQQEELVTEELP